MVIALIIVLVMFFIAALGVAILIPRMLRMQEIIDEHFEEKDKRFSEISEVLQEYSEHVKSIAALDIYLKDENLKNLATHSNWIVMYIQGIDEKASYEWEDWKSIEKRLEKPITVAEISTVRTPKESDNK